MNVHPSRAAAISSFRTAFGTEDIMYDIRNRLGHLTEPKAIKVCAVLEAMTSYILERRQTVQGNANASTAPSAVEYFAALMFSLEESASNGDGDTVGATASLLTVALSSLSQDVIRSRYQAICEVLTQQLAQYSAHSYAARHLLSCLRSVLNNIGGSAWANKAVLRAFSSLTFFTVDPRAKVRKMGQEIVSDVLLTVSKSFRAAKAARANVHTGAGSSDVNEDVKQPEIYASLPKQLVDTMVGQLVRELDNCTVQSADEETRSIPMYVCGLLQATIFLLPPHAVARVVQPLLNMASTGNPILTVQLLRVLDKLFLSDTRGKFVAAKDLRFLDDDGVDQMDELMSDVPFARATGPAEAKMIIHLVDKLPEMRPHLADVAVTRAFTNTVVNGLVRLTHLSDHSIGGERVPKFVDMLISMLLSPKTDAVFASSKAITRLFTNCLTDELVSHSLSMHSAVNQGSRPSPLQRIVMQLKTAMGYRFKAVWGEVFQACSSLFQNLESKAYGFAAPLIEALDALYGSHEVDGIFINPLRKAIGAAIANFGPHLVLQTLPLNLPTSDSVASRDGVNLAEAIEQSRSWLLPVLKAKVRRTHLAFFEKEMLPLAEDMLLQQDISEGDEKPIEAKAYQTIAIQIWDTFPSFASDPLDLAAAFPSFCRQLGEAMTDRRLEFARPQICKALMVMIHKNKRKANRDRYAQEAETDGFCGAHLFGFELPEFDDNNQHFGGDAAAAAGNDGNDEDQDQDETATKAEAEANLAVLAKFAKPFLSRLFNVARELAPERRELVLQTVTAYASIADGGLVNELLQRTLKLLLNKAKELNAVRNASEDEVKVKSNAGASLTPAQIKVNKIEECSDAVHVLCDIATALSPFASHDNIRRFLQCVNPFLKNSRDSSSQKKAYRAIATVCAFHEEFVQQNWSQVVDMVTTSHEQCHSAALRSRLQCLKQVVVHVPKLLTNPELLEKLPELLMEAVLATKESNQKTRHAAFDVLVSLGHRMLNTQVDPSQLAISDASRTSSHPLMAEYFCMVVAPLARTHPHIQSAAVLALSTLLYTFSSHIPTTTVTDLLDTMTLLLQQQKGAEVIKSVLGFIKVATLRLGPQIMDEHMPKLVPAVCKWVDGHRFKGKIKTLFEIFVRKFGLDRMREVTPRSHIKLVTYINKQKERERRIKAEMWKANRKDARREKNLSKLQDKGSSSNAVIEDFEDIMGGSDGEDDGQSSSRGRGRNTDTTMGSAGAPTHGRKGKRAAAAAASGAQALYIADEEVDFMDQGVVRKVVTSNGRRSDRKAVSETTSADGTKYSEDGKLVFPGLLGDSDDEDDSRRGRAGRQAPAYDSDGDDDDNDDAQAAPNTHVRKSKRKTPEPDALLSGQLYRSRRGGGDMRRAGALEPFAYHPLSGAMMNRRTKKRATRDFENMLQAAKSGSKAGRKAKGKHGAIFAKRKGRR
jgi:ribosomal RNA-processing protein 12